MPKYAHSPCLLWGPSRPCSRISMVTAAGTVLVGAFFMVVCHSPLLIRKGCHITLLLPLTVI